MLKMLSFYCYYYFWAINSFIRQCKDRDNREGVEILATKKETLVMTILVGLVA